MDARKSPSQAAGAGESKKQARSSCPRNQALLWRKTFWKQWLFNCSFTVKMLIKIDLTLHAFLHFYHVHLSSIKKSMNFFGKKDLCNLISKA